ncbi:MAG: DNA gyrase inhibitor YacG [Candidatus Dadabacteria bacterium]|nr:DNA gyrase inhibitor YacG [Candidatus Dadabacteria bacterium]
MKVTCPTCGEEIQWEDTAYRPFCSERCKLIDLGTWADEQYAVPVEDAIDLDEVH